MKRRYLKPEEYAGKVMAGLKQGSLLVTKAGDKVNAMTIAWGLLGIELSKPYFVALVREGRFTHEMLEANGEFCVSVPQGNFDRHILGICGARTGRTHDKITEAGLTLIEPEVISVPAVQEFSLTLECRVTYSQNMDLGDLPREIVEDHYPQDVDSSHPLNNKDPHTLYHGEIVSAYVLEGESN